MMRIFGLIGYPLTHSFSKKYFQEKFRSENIEGCSYELFPLENISTFRSLLADNPGLCGLNVTIPYKEQVIPFLDELDEVAKRIGAVNTIKISNGKLKGYNTDAYGFMKSILPLLKKEYTQALVLGTGGASRAVAYVLEKLGLHVTMISRYAKENVVTYKELNEDALRANHVIVNTTPAGMFPDTEACPEIPYRYLTSNHVLFDLIYNPEETLFLKKGKEHGAQVKNGYEMLALQAEEAWRIWNLKEHADNAD